LVKCLCTDILPDKTSYNDLYSSLIKTFYFKPETDYNFSIIKPYFLITNGNEIISFKEENNISIGLSFFIGQSKQLDKYIKNGESLENIIYESILLSIREHFLKIEQKVYFPKVCAAKTKIKDLPTTINVDLNDEEIKIISTQKAVCSMDKRFIMPIYICLFDSSKSISLVPRNANNSINMPCSIIKYDQELLKSLSFMSKKVLSIIASGDIVF